MCVHGGSGRESRGALGSGCETQVEVCRSGCQGALVR